MNRDRIQRFDYAIGLVIYHPEENLFKRINQMIELGFQVYVFDNSPFDEKYAKAIKDNHNITYMTAGKNVGLGYSLSTLCATAYAHNYQKLLFLDQDTGISHTTLDFIARFSTTLPLEIQLQYAVIVFSGTQAPEDSVTEVRLAISSGSLFNLHVLRQIGWHNDKYFVDCVDYEFCVRARRCGFKIGIVKNTPDFDHVTEQPDRAIELFGKHILIRRYSKSRIYDAIGAYAKIIIGGIVKNRLIDTCILFKSMMIYVAGQILSRLIKEK